MKIKITPLDIRQRVFEKAMRGYDREEVTAFLHTLSREWENMQDELRELRSRLAAREHEISKLREVEESLFKTLKAAENTGANVVEQAHKEAEFILKEAHKKAETIQQTAETRARNKTEEAYALARDTLSRMDIRLKEATKHYEAIERAKNELMGLMKRAAEDMLEKVSRMRDKTPLYDVAQNLSATEQKVRVILESENALSRIPDAEENYAPTTGTNLEPPNINPRSERSFFDEIE